MEKSDDAQKRATSSLEEMKKAGVNFFVDGEEVSLSEAMNRAVREESCYMADYVLDCAGKVAQVRFDKVDLS